MRECIGYSLDIDRRYHDVIIQAPIATPPIRAGRKRNDSSANRRTSTEEGRQHITSHHRERRNGADIITYRGGNAESAA
eukprot:8247205-Alexandrium_andersonii.AAC.1